jgi:hypothetical protein
MGAIGEGEGRETGRPRNEPPDLLLRQECKGNLTEGRLCNRQRQDVEQIGDRTQCSPEFARMTSDEVWLLLTRTARGTRAELK